MSAPSFYPEQPTPEPDRTAGEDLSRAAGASGDKPLRNPPYDEWQLQRLAELHQERARLRTFARASIVWGLINMTLGVLALQDHPINLLLVLIGLFMLLEGVWFSVRPSVRGPWSMPWPYC